MIKVNAKALDAEKIIASAIGSARADGRDVSFAERLRSVMSGSTQADFAKEIGMSQAGLNKLLQGGEPRLSTLIAIANARGVPVGWLAAGDAAEGPLGEYVSIPKLAFRASAGTGSLVFDDTETETIRFPKRILDHIGVGSDDALAMDAWGDSMSSTIEDGSLLIVDKSDNRFRDGKIFAFTLGDEVFVKRLLRRGSGIVRSSDNKEFFPDDEPIHHSEPFSIIGRVKWTERVL